MNAPKKTEVEEKEKEVQQKKPSVDWTDEGITSLLSLLLLLLLLFSSSFLSLSPLTFYHQLIFLYFFKQTCVRG